MAAPWIHAASAHLPQDRASRLIVLLGLSVVVCLTLLGGYLIRDIRNTAWSQATRNATNLLVLLEEGVGRNVRQYDAWLQAMAARANRPDLAALSPELRRLIMLDPSGSATGLDVYTLVDASGRVILSSDDRSDAWPYAAGIPNFETHRAEPEAGLLVSGPLGARLDGKTVIALSRRIDGADGSFGGAVVGAIHLDYFRSFFSRLRVEEGVSISVVSSDGLMIVRHPDLDTAVGHTVAGREVFNRFLAAPRGLFVQHSELVRRNRMFAFAKLDGLPLIVNVAVDVEAIRKDWLGRAVAIGLLIVGLCGLTIALTFVLQREVERRNALAVQSNAANAELSRLALTDSLTGLPNRRHYDAVLTRRFNRAIRTSAPLALLVLDTDYFKRYNDHFGHHQGDKVLQAVAKCLLKHLERPGSVACRIGGEEFAVILPGLSMDEAGLTAERIRRSVMAMAIPHAPDVGGPVTISIGVAHTLPQLDDAPEAVFAQADAALYDAKHSGRNRVRLAVRPVRDRRAHADEVNYA